MNKTRIIFLFIIISFAFLLTGCWDRKEVNDLAIITAAGFDKNSDDMIELSVLVFIPKSGDGGQQMGGGGSGGGQHVLVRSADGITIADAMSKLQQKFPRRLFWGHADVFIIGENLAKEDVRPHLDFILRHPQLRERANIFVSKQSAKEIISLTPPLERDSAEVLHEMAALKIGMDVTVKKFAQMLIGKSTAAAAPYIEILPPPKGKKKEETIGFITGTAVFKKGKMIDVIDEHVTRGVLWLRNEIKLAIVSVKPEDVEGHVSLSLLRAKTKLKPSIKDGKWKITLKAETEDDIIKNGTNLDLQDPKIVRKLEQYLIEDIKQKVQTALDIVQKEMNADIFGFAEAFHRAYPDIWEKNKDEWDEIFPNVEVEIDAKAYIRRPGMVTQPAVIPKEEVKNE